MTEWRGRAKVMRLEKALFLFFRFCRVQEVINNVAQSIAEAAKVFTFCNWIQGFAELEK
ncbi:hypothetical protein Syun_028964 [Stephania yunnanensis]|uniref:Uncharacterized protein n=1 Tax=Stephania yunnanensis TaxID=152371 RepID=A0AAP0E730_9MAGN